MLRCVAACSHIRTFIAGAASTGLSVASSSVVARSSACPVAIFASRSAVAGATTTRSASRESWICPISTSSLRSKRLRSEEHTSELQSLMRISYAVFCLKKKKQKQNHNKKQHSQLLKNTENSQNKKQ